MFMSSQSSSLLESGGVVLASRRLLLHHSFHFISLRPSWTFDGAQSYPLMLEQLHHRVPVTALAFLARYNVILSGEGPVLHAYDADYGHLLTSLPIFYDQAIHGIALSPDGVSAVAWGNSSFGTFSFNQDDGFHFTSGSIARTSDWILDAAFCTELRDKEHYDLAVVTAHNALVLSLTDGGHMGNAVIEPTVLGSNCILYSAHIQWLDGSHVLVASGTAFGDVIVWSCFLSQNGSGYHVKTIQTHYTFSAHEGSVFGVQISPFLSFSRQQGTELLLATCSDDRSIKIWNISDLPAQNPTSTQPQLERDTGFGPKMGSEEHAPPCLAKAMGHGSRIWHVRFHVDQVPHGSPDSSECTSILSDVSVISFGEDAVSIVWTMRPSRGGSMPYMLSRMTETSAHAGKQIWSVATGTFSQIITGGADGAISIQESIRPPTLASEIQCCQATSPDSYRSYAYIDGSLIATTDQGRVVLISSVSSEGMAISEDTSAALPGLRGYSVVAGEDMTAFIAGTDGIIYRYYYPTNSLDEFAETAGKVAGLFTCGLGAGNLSLLVTSVGSQSASIYLHVGRDRQDKDSVGSLVDRRQLQLPNSFVVTSFSMFPITDQGSMVVLGSRGGSLAVFDIGLADDGTTRPYNTLLDNIHNGETVTALHCHTWRKGDGLELCLYSTGRDGTLAIHILHCASRRTTAGLVHQLSLPFGPNIEGLAVIEDALLIWGFKGKVFVAYNVSTQREIMTVECGGSHRNWVFRPDLRGGTFVWTKASKVYRITESEVPHRSINTGGHGREIKTLAIFSGSDAPIIATGAEDTNIKLFTPLADSFQCRQTLKKHVTGIQHLQWSVDGSYLFSSGGFEQFFVWRVREGIPLSELGVVCESSHPNNGSSDLRIMGFDVQATDSAYTITMAYSNSTLRQWLYSRSTGWELLASGDYLTACLTHVRYLGNTDTLLSASTDGHLALWSSTAHRVFKWTHRHKVHQSSILSLTLRTLPNASTLIMTGGDDNAIGLTLLSPGISSSIQRPSLYSTLIIRAHTAAVTGLATYDLGLHGLSLVSCSTDQRLILWQVDLNADNHVDKAECITVEKLQNVPTPVADVSGLAIWGTQVLVAGVGLDMWSLVNHKGLAT